MTRKYKFPFFTFLFSLLFFLPHAAHGRLAVHHIHRSLLPHGQHVHRQISLSNVTGSLLPANEDSPDPGGTSSSPPSTNTAPDDSPATTAPTATTTPSSSDPLNPVNNLLLPGSSSSPPPQTSDPPSSTDSTPTSPATSNPPSSSDSTPSPSPTSSNPPSSPSTSSPASATCALGLDPFGQCILPPASTDVSSSSVASSGTPASTDVSSSSVASSQSQTSGTPLLSDILPSLSSNAPASSSPPSSNTAASSAPTSSGTPILPDILPSLSSDAPTSSSPPSSDTPASSAPTSSGTPILPDILPSLSSDAPTSSSPPSSDTPASSAPTSSGTPILPDILPPISSSAPTSSAPPSSSDAPTSPLLSNTPVSLPLPLSDNPTSSTPPSSNTPVSSPLPSPSNAPISLLPSSAPISLPALSSNTPNSLPSASVSPSPDNQSSPAPSSSAPIDPCGPVGLLLGLCATSGIPASAPIPSSGSFPTSQLPSPSSALSPSQSGLSSIPGSFSQSASDPAAESSSGSPTASSSPPVISFPSYTTGQNDQTTGVPSTFAGPSAPVFTQNSQFSYVTVTSLLGAYIPSSSIPPTLTNPDAATTTLSLPDPSNSAAGPVPSAPLPADLPARIYPPNMVSTSDLPTNDVLCSILFTSFLNWEFVVTHTQSQGQIFLWTPIIIATALNISLSDTPPFALQVFVPATYEGPSDAPMLLTEYLFYLQEDLVPVLANQIKVISSPFYTIGLPYGELAKQVDAAFALTSVPNPNTVPGATSAASGGNKSRTATIIGVVSALGGLALVILGILIFNGVKRSRELRHQRLSDPNLPNDPYPDRTGRDFDQDSVGGPRRRSFYFAEDSLRGQSQTAEQSTVPMAQAQTQFVVQPESQIQYISRSSPENIRERRAPVVPGTISAPVLTQSSLNW